MNRRPRHWQSNKLAAYSLVACAFVVFAVSLILDKASIPYWEKKSLEIQGKPDFEYSSEFGAQLQPVADFYIGIPVAIKFLVVVGLSCHTFAIIARWTVPMTAMFTILNVCFFLVVANHFLIYLDKIIFPFGEF